MNEKKRYQLDLSQPEGDTGGVYILSVIMAGIFTAIILRLFGYL